MRWSGLFMLALVSATACGGKGAGGSSDAADRPAVVKAPPVILPSDTAKPDTTALHAQHDQEIKRAISEAHSFMGAMVVLGDRGMLASYYEPEATMRIADSTFRGQQAIANGLVQLARRTSIKEIVRQPWKVHFTATTVVDSGVYGIMSQRDGSPERLEQRGNYVTVWHKGDKPDQPWIVSSDVVAPGKVTKAPSDGGPAKSRAPTPTKKG